MAAADDTLAGSLGVAPRVITTARRGLTEGLHWTQDERGRVEWLPAGVDALRASLGLPAAEKIEGGGGLDPARLLGWAAAPAAADPAPVELTLRICRMLPNPLFVAVDHERRAVPVRVRRTSRLAIGRSLRCRIDADGTITCISPTFAP